jgi:legumain
MKSNGIPEEQIILMAYDDVANNSQNPFPGKLFNKPDGEDVYAGCNIDYTGREVTKNNFIAVLEGDATKAGGKVLSGDADSKVFVNFIDHGAPGLIAFPSEYMYSDELNSAIKQSKANGLFGEMVFYLEACESGSMFDNDQLASDSSVYALTATNASTSSWGTYCYPSDMVNGVHINSCLGDLFSVNWMEDTDKGNMKESLLEQYNQVKTLTTKSPVLQWGDMSFESDSIGEFEGDYATLSRMEYLFNKAKLYSVEQTSELLNQVKYDTMKQQNVVSSRDAQLHHLTAKVLEDGSAKNHMALTEELQNRMTVDTQVEQVFSYHFDKEIPAPTDFDCLRSVVDHWENECGKLSDYGLQYVKYMVAECESIKLFPAAVEETYHKITKACTL